MLLSKLTKLDETLFQKFRTILFGPLSDIPTSYSKSMEAKAYV